MKRVFQNYVLFLILIVVVGCSKNLPISGTVTFSDDGSPLSAGAVIFDDGVKQARAAIKPDGSFVMGFEKENNGVPAGSYNVTISGAVKLLPNPDDVYPPPSENLIDEKYANPATSGLTINVDGSNNKFDIKVDRPKK
ncbi:MAG: carboxypeptidase-like regulatory domain-containing protein [Planctomycetaceae bacterium]|jgi:hypothetical protein|nr:carboxypeptidase-like regulatory domain-containing protein [Planctomycetaceae bacterium]